MESHKRTLATNQQGSHQQKLIVITPRDLMTSAILCRIRTEPGSNDRVLKIEVWSSEYLGIADLIINRSCTSIKTSSLVFGWRSFNPLPSWRFPQLRQSAGKAFQIRYYRNGPIVCVYFLSAGNPSFITCCYIRTPEEK